MTLKLEGRLAGPVVEELRRTWSSLSTSIGERDLQIDLRNVMFADYRGIALLAEICYRTGARFQADTPLLKYFAEEAIRKSRNLLSHKGA